MSQVPSVCEATELAGGWSLSIVFHIRLFHPDRRKSSQNLVERIYVTVTHASKYCHISQVKKYIGVNYELVGEGVG